MRERYYGTFNDLQVKIFLSVVNGAATHKIMQDCNRLLGAVCVDLRVQYNRRVSSE